jgi:hypothetical protein
MRTRGASSSTSELAERVLNRSAPVTSVNRRCRSYFGSFSTTLDLRLFQQNRPEADIGIIFLTATDHSIFGRKPSWKPPDLRWHRHPIIFRRFPHRDCRHGKARFTERADRDAVIIRPNVERPTHGRSAVRAKMIVKLSTAGGGPGISFVFSVETHVGPVEVSVRAQR